jgi:AraC-like DNA-binding protein
MTSSVSNPAHPRSTWQEARQDHNITGAVQQIVTTLLPDGYPGLHCVAELVRLSPRTLQRRLCDEGLSFAHVVTRVRLDVARRMLADPGRKVIDVALELGYSDPAHFTRAFARWTGLTPREFQRLRSTPAPGSTGPAGSAFCHMRAVSGPVRRTRRGPQGEMRCQGDKR